MEPHPRVHRGRREHRLVGGEQRRGRQIVGDAMRHLGHDVGGRRGHHHDIGLLPQPDVGDVALGGQRERVGVGRPAGEGLDRERGHKFGTGTGQDAAHLGAALPEPPDEVEAFVGGDAACDHQQHPLALSAALASAPPSFPASCMRIRYEAAATAAREWPAPVRASAPRAGATSGSPQCCRRSPARSACRGRRAG